LRHVRVDPWISSTENSDMAIDYRNHRLVLESFPPTVAEVFVYSNIHTWGDLAGLSQAWLFSKVGIGRLALGKIEQRLKWRGLELKSDTPRHFESRCDALKFTAPETTAPGVYFLRAQEFIKVGYATNIRQRMRWLQTGFPFELELLAFIPCANVQRAKALERELHQRLASERVRGEWFKGAAVDEYIDRLLRVAA
jgi:hypothetical protein